MNLPIGAQANQLTVLFVILYVWTIFWKGIALWKSAHYKQKIWFVVFLLPINTAGILEIIYLTKFAKTKLTFNEFKSWFSKK